MIYIILNSCQTEVKAEQKQNKIPESNNTGVTTKDSKGMADLFNEIKKIADEQTNPEAKSENGSQENIVDGLGELFSALEEAKQKIPQLEGVMEKLNEGTGSGNDLDGMSDIIDGLLKQSTQNKNGVSMIKQMKVQKD